LATISTLTAAREDDDGRLAPRPFLFRVLDCAAPLAPSARHLLAGLDSVAVGRGPDEALRTLRTLRLAFPDPYMSTTHALFTQRGGRWRVEDRSKNGTWLNGERIAEAPLADGDVLELAGTFFIFRDALEVGDGEHADVRADEPPPPAEGLATLLPPLRRTFAHVGRIARSGVPVVLRGETGTGKEVLARAIHALSGRPGAFVAVNCGALPDNLVESELFGYRRGAFSGASEDRTGLVRTADRGTLLLDEIGDLPLPSQAALLRVLQEREVMPVGGTRPMRVDLRVIAASHLDLAALVAEKRFRADLEARLAGIELTLPPLRERREDLGLLAAAILRRVAPDPAQVSFEKAAVRGLLRHGWPKNVRELVQALTSAVVLAGRQPIALAHLPAALRAPAPPPAPPDDDPELRAAVIAALQAEGGNVSAAARRMGKERKQLQRWLKRFALDPERFRPR
jgi:DNA-binding NtrC family response regulator